MPYGDFEPEDPKVLVAQLEFQLMSAKVFGLECSFGTGLDQVTTDCINEIAQAWPKDLPSQETKARAAFRGERVR
jgi:hypothetical protein